MAACGVTSQVACPAERRSHGMPPASSGPSEGHRGLDAPPGKGAGLQKGPVWPWEADRGWCPDAAAPGLALRGFRRLPTELHTWGTVWTQPPESSCRCCRTAWLPCPHGPPSSVQEPLVGACFSGRTSHRTQNLPVRSPGLAPQPCPQSTAAQTLFQALWEGRPVAPT